MFRVYSGGMCRCFVCVRAVYPGLHARCRCRLWNNQRRGTEAACSSSMKDKDACLPGRRTSKFGCFRHRARPPYSEGWGRATPRGSTPSTSCGGTRMSSCRSANSFARIEGNRSRIVNGGRTFAKAVELSSKPAIVDDSPVGSPEGNRMHRRQRTKSIAVRAGGRKQVWHTAAPCWS